MRICICDDDKLVIKQLSDYIQTFFKRYHIKNYEIALFTDGESLLHDSAQKDIVFLDIEMPGMNGIYVGQTLRKRNQNIIIFIVTSYSEYLDEAMRFHVFRYLSKPVDKQRLFRNLKDALQFYNTATATLAVETKDGIYTVLTSHIIFVEATARKVIVHTTDCDYESVQNMQYWLQKLPSGSFFQSHRSYIINFAYVTDFSHGLIHLHHNHSNAYLTHKKYTAFKNAYLLYLESTR